MKDDVLEEFAGTLSGLSEAEVRTLIFVRVPSASERKAFDAASKGISREALTLLAASYLARQKVKAEAPASDPGSGVRILSSPRPPVIAREAPSAPGRGAAAIVAPTPPAATETVEEKAHHPGFHPGATIAGKYVVERLIGEGELGVVVAARNVLLDHPVAITYLRPQALATRAVAERFLGEARLAAKIQSEHVVHVYDVGTLPDGAPYMVMEYLAGMDLGRLMSAKGPLPVDRAIDYVLQACEGLAAAHVAGIVHGDIKPDNLFIATSRAGTPVLKVLNLGMSKVSSSGTLRGAPDAAEARDPLGSPAYMSPEQLRASGEVDARSDVWSMGVVLYELLTGTRPFDGDSAPAMSRAILHRPPTPVFLARPDLPIRLQSVIEQCLAKDVANRFQNVAELAQALRPFAGLAGRERIEQLIAMTLAAGDKVRSSAPRPVTSSVDALHEVLTLAEGTERPVAMPRDGVASWAPADARKKVARRDLARPLATVAVGVGVAFAVAAMIGRLARPAPPAERTVVPAAASAPPAQTSAPEASALEVEELAHTLVEGPRAVDSPPPVVEGSPVSVLATGLKAPGLPQPVRKGLRRAPKPPGPSSANAAKEPLKADTDGVINPFE